MIFIATLFNLINVRWGDSSNYAKYARNFYGDSCRVRLWSAQCQVSTLSHLSCSNDLATKLPASKTDPVYKSLAKLYIWILIRGWAVYWDSWGVRPRGGVHFTQQKQSPPQNFFLSLEIKSLKNVVVIKKVFMKDTKHLSLISNYVHGRGKNTGVGRGGRCGACFLNSFPGNYSSIHGSKYL